MNIDNYVSRLLAQPAPWYAPKVPAIRGAIARAHHPGELHDMLAVILGTQGSPGARELQMSIVASLGESNGVRVPRGWPPEWDERRVQWRRTYTARRLL